MLGEISVLPLVRVLEDNQRAPAVRANAATLLGRIGDDRALVPLVSVLVDTTAPAVVRTGAVLGLSHLDNTGALDALLRVLQNRDTGRTIRLSVARNLRDRRAFEPLLGLLRATDDDEHVRAAVTERLCWFGGEQAIDPLLGTLDDPNLKVRQAALWALAECGDARVFPALEHTGARDPALAPHTLLVSAAIKRRLGLPLTSEEDPMGPVIARYGRLTVHAPKHGRSPNVQGRIAYLVRLLDDQGYVDLDKPIPLVPDDQTDVLRVIRAQLQYTRNATLRRTEQLRGIEDSIDEAGIQQDVARLERQGRALAFALRELEDEEGLA